MADFRITITLAALAAAAALALPGAAAAQQPADVLPNLVQAEPFDVGVQTAVVRGRTRFRLGFDSATENRGRGVLTLHGSRPSTASPLMTIDQLITRSDGSTRRVRQVGTMRYVVHSDHQHWHTIGFERYALRPIGRRGPTRRDRKTGFCLGDRYQVRGASRLPGFNPEPGHNTRCGLRRPGLLEVLVGISTGWGDDYTALLEGQYIDVTGLPAGRYLLTHTANGSRSIVESRYDDNKASAALRIAWPRGMRRPPRLTVLRNRR